MIVNETPNCWNIFFQRAHGLLAGKIAFSLKKDCFLFPQYYFETINSIAEHDNGQSEWQNHTHLNDKGEPIDFRDKGVDLEQAYRTVNNSKYKSLWQALLTSIHTHSLYQPYKSDDTKIEAFLIEQEKFQENIFKTLQVKKSLVHQEYQLFRLCDELSLAICKNSLQDKAQEIGSIQGTTYYASINKGFIEIEPWCFKENKIQIISEMYSIPHKTFKEDKDLWKEVENSEPIFLAYNFTNHGIL